MSGVNSNSSCLVRFWGVRGSIATPGPKTVGIGGNTSCVEVRAEDTLVVLDAGTGIRGLGQALLNEFGSAPLDLNLLITHTHWDHIQGFPFFAPAYRTGNRLNLFGPDRAGLRLASFLDSQMDRVFFPIALSELPAHLRVEEVREGKFQVGRIQAEAIGSNHPGSTLGYRLHTGAGAICYVPDHESFGHLHHPSRGSAAEQEAAFLQFIRDAEVLIIDSQYRREECQARKGWGHGCIEELVPMAIRANVRQLFLFHHDPDRDDQQVAESVEMARRIARSSQSTLQIEAAREGMEVRLG